jgi:single-stranded DNA-binding protein
VQVLVDGRLSQGCWETVEGKPRTKYEVVVNTVQFLKEKQSELSRAGEKCS